MDEARFEAAWNEHGQALTRYCTFSTGSSSDGEDIAAETFSRLLSTKRSIGSAKVEAWLFTVARNLCVNYHRANGRTRRLLTRLSDEPSRSVEDAWTDSELWEAVRALEERSRLVVYLRVIEDRPFADVARLMKISESAAKMAYYRATTRLRASLRPDQTEHLESHVGGVADVD